VVYSANNVFNKECFKADLIPSKPTVLNNSMVHNQPPVYAARIIKTLLHYKMEQFKESVKAVCSKNTPFTRNNVYLRWLCRDMAPCLKTSIARVTFSVNTAMAAALSNSRPSSSLHNYGNYFRSLHGYSFLQLYMYPTIVHLTALCLLVYYNIIKFHKNLMTDE